MAGAIELGRLGGPLGTAVRLDPAAAYVPVTAGAFVGLAVDRAQLLPPAADPDPNDLDAMLRVLDSPAVLGLTTPSIGWAIGAGIAAALLLLASIFLHELGHWVGARRTGVGADALELTVTGGFVELRDPERLSAGRLAVIAGAGPLVTAVLAAATFVVAIATADPDSSAGAAVHTVATAGALANGAGLVINLLPLRSLDGRKLWFALRLWRRRVRG